MKEVKITCDCCGKDITNTDSYPAYRLVLSVEKLPHTSDIIFDIYVYPPIKHTMYFCDKECLIKLLDKKHENTNN